MRAADAGLLGRMSALQVAEAAALLASLREGVHPMHARQVADLAARVAAELGLSAEQVLRCRLAGLVHDVGKVTVPDSVLAKPGPLDDDEWGVMRRHSRVGAEIVRHLAGLADVAPAVLHHHERWDGGGYPDGLAGEAIPVEARVLACADAYSAMTSDRLYRRQVSREAAVQELRASACSHFDPAVVEALLRAVAAAA